MSEKDITVLLDELKACANSLREEKIALENQVKMLETEISSIREVKGKEIDSLTEAKSKEIQALQETNDRLSQELKEVRQKLDRFHPGLQSLQDELQNAEMQTNLLDMELTKKDEAIKKLQSRLSEYTSLIPTSVSLEDSSSTP